jgi:dynein light chain Tctex-type 1
MSWMNVMGGWLDDDAFGRMDIAEGAEGGQLEFNQDEVKEIVTDGIESTLKDYGYSQGKVDQWAATIIESCLKRLASLERPFKYVVTCVIVERAGAGLQSACCAFWDPNTDGILPTYTHLYTLIYTCTHIYTLIYTCTRT